MKITKLLCGLMTVTSIMLGGCDEEEGIVETVPEVRDHWEAIDMQDAQLNLASRSRIHFGLNNQLYVIQKALGSSFTYCSCKDENEQWQRSLIDSIYSFANWTFLTREESDGVVWVLTDTRLIGITSCGVSESYVVASSDTISYANTDDRFVGFQVKDRIAWLLHRKWGLYEYDLNNNIMTNRTNNIPYPYNPLEQKAPYNSMAVDINGSVWVANEEGYVWAYNLDYGWGELFPSQEKYRSFRACPSGDVHVDFTGSNGQSRTIKLDDGTTIPILPLNTSPNYFNTSVYDRTDHLAYFSGQPYVQPFIGLLSAGAEPRIVNARHAVEDGNVQIHHIGFNTTNELYAATDRGIFKYLGSDE
jgi:hypothetical protein